MQNRQNEKLPNLPNVNKTRLKVAKHRLTDQTIKEREDSIRKSLLYSS